MSIQNTRFGLMPLTLLCLGGLLMIPGVSTQAQNDVSKESTTHPQRRLTVTGQAEIKAKPDKADIVIGVVTENKASKVAVRANAEAASEVQAAIRKVGIPEKDIQTTAYQLEPIYSGGGQRSDGSVIPQKISGYRVSNQVRVTVSDLTKLSDVLDTATSTGSNSVEGPFFGLSNAEELADSILEKAIQSARKKADLIAKASGVNVIGVYDIIVGSQPRPFMAMAMAGRAMKADAATPISPGELTVNAEVTIVYEIINVPGTAGQK